MGWARVRIEVVGEPPLLLANGAARLRVRGWVPGGVVRCQGERRWAWGTFDETFVVRPPEDGRVELCATGAFGAARVRLRLEPLASIQSPPFPLASSRASADRRARLARVRTRLPSVRAPRVPRVGGQGLDGVGEVVR